MSDTASHSEATLAAAARVLADQRAGGRRIIGPAIGRRSAGLRQRWRLRRIAFAGGLALLLLPIGHIFFGLIGLAVGAAAMALLFLILLGIMLGIAKALTGGAVPAPSVEALRAAPARRLMAKAQLWLEAQRGEFPPAALPVLRQIGGQLDNLANQLDRIDETAPAVAQVRALVAEHLPAVVTAYTAIPRPLRAAKNGDASPDEQLIAAFSRINGEITSVTRQLAEGALDRLTIETRFLDLKFGGGEIGS